MVEASQAALLRARVQDGPLLVVPGAANALAAPGTGTAALKPCT
jgi:hypothetical protein